MARPKTEKTEFNPPAEAGPAISLSTLLSQRRVFRDFSVWIVGDTPLITHAWSEKARREMLQKQVKATKAGRDTRDPEQDFVNSLYDLGDGTYGFPAMGVKKAILSEAHKDKGIARSDVMRSLWLKGDMYSVRPALASAVCNMPLLRIYGTSPVMREDMVKVGAMVKTASLTYRGQFTNWGMKITGSFNESVIKPEALAFLITGAGISAGLGEWRNEKGGMFGSFHLAMAEEEKAWEAFAAGKSKTPPNQVLQAVA